MKDFEWIVHSAVTLQDIEVAQKIQGDNLSVPDLKGKTTKSKPPPVVSDFVKVPQEILDIHKAVIISANVFFVNGNPFLLTISWHLAFTTVSRLENKKIETGFKHFLKVYKMYKD